MHLFHNWAKWQDVIFTDVNTNKKYSAQSKRCKKCNKCKNRIIVTSTS